MRRPARQSASGSVIGRQPGDGSREADILWRITTVKAFTKSGRGPRPQLVLILSRANMPNPSVGRELEKERAENWRVRSVEGLGGLPQKTEAGGCQRGLEEKLGGLEAQKKARGELKQDGRQRKRKVLNAGTPAEKGLNSLDLLGDSPRVGDLPLGLLSPPSILGPPSMLGGLELSPRPKTCSSKPTS